MAVSASDQQNSAKIDIESDVDPVELAAMTKSVLGIEQAPTTAMQTPGSSQFSATSATLGPPFDAESVTLSQMRQLRKDPMIAFALHYRKVPIARAEWYVEARDKNGVNRQVAAFVDAAVRRIWARYVFQRTLALDFGFQAMAKRWVLSNPGGVYFDPTATTPETAVLPIWNEGNVLPKVWKAPVALRPELVQPIFDPKTQEFAGITYSVPTTSAAQDASSSTSGRTGSKKNAKGTMTIDTYHALWGTNQRDTEHGSIYGYPLTGHARDYWWTYRFLLGLANRAYERMAIPPLLAYFPPGFTVTDATTGAKRANLDLALEMGERLRSNAVAAVPSTMAETGIGETSNTQRAWDFKFLDTPYESLGIFNERFNYLNVMKLRATWVPELAFISNQSGGNSGGNIAEQMGEIFTSSQQLLMDEIIDEINSYMIPDLLWLNFPEFVNAGGRATMKAKGFRAEDMDLYKQLIQLFGQADPSMLAQLDVTELLRRVDLPLLSPEEYLAQRQQVANQVQQVPNIPGVTIANPVANPGVNTGFTNGGSTPEPNQPSQQPASAGFSDIGYDYIYMQPQQHIDLELAETDDFLSGLPSTKHYSDKALRALAVQLRRLWSAHWRRLYPDFAKHVASIKSIEFEDEDLKLIYTNEGWAFADDANKRVNVSKTKATKAAKKIMASFGISSKQLKQLTERSAIIIRKMVNRAIVLDLKDSGLKSDYDESTIDDFVTAQSGLLVNRTHKTFKDEVQDHLIQQIMDGSTPAEIADDVVSHFDSMPTSKAERVARSETRDAVNAGTLIAGTGANVRYVKATDGEEFDPDCKKRNGKLFTIREAWKELGSEHPYGTLGFQLMPRADFSIEYVGRMPEGHEDKFAYFDDETSTAFISRELNGDEIDTYLVKLSDRLVMNGRR